MFSKSCFVFHFLQAIRIKDINIVKSISEIFEIPSDFLQNILLKSLNKATLVFFRLFSPQYVSQDLLRLSKAIQRFDGLIIITASELQNKFFSKIIKKRIILRGKAYFILVISDSLRHRGSRQQKKVHIAIFRSCYFRKIKLQGFLIPQSNIITLDHCSIVVHLLTQIFQSLYLFFPNRTCSINYSLFSNIIGKLDNNKGSNLPIVSLKKSNQLLAQFAYQSACNIQLQQYLLKLRKMMQKPSYCSQILTKTSIQSQKCVKPCIKYENLEEKSSIIKEESKESLGEEMSQKDHPKILEDQNDSLSDDSLDSDILEEHKAVIDVLFKENSIPQSYSHLIMGNQKQTQKSIESPIFKQITLQHYLSIRLEKLKLSKPSLVRLFNSFLMEEKTCYRFMQHLYYSYPASIVDRVFKYIFYVWELYYPCLKRKLAVDQVISISKKISEKIFRCDLASKTHPENAREENRLRLRKLVKVFTLTFVLVMERCFANPYFKPSRLFGQQSDEQTTQVLQLAETGRKIIKQDSLSLSS